jgi:hypothetical protein
MDAPWGHALAELILAGVSTLRGDVRQAMTRLEAAETAFHAQHMGLYAAVARQRRGQISDRPDAGQLLESAQGWMRSQSIVEPSRFAEMLAPGAFSHQPRNVISAVPRSHRHEMEGV